MSSRNFVKSTNARSSFTSQHSPVNSKNIVSPMTQKGGTKTTKSPSRSTPSPTKTTASTNKSIGYNSTSPQKPTDSSSPQKSSGHSSPQKLQREKTFSTLKSSESQALEDFITCELCRQMLDDPKTLSCLHSYCQGCLRTYIPETSGNSNDANVIICPLCLQTTDAPKEAKSIDEWTKYLPTNAFLAGYLEAVALKDQNRRCDTCRRQGKRQAAENWCSACHDALCDECLGVHSALKTTKKHKVVPIDKVRKQPIETIIAVPHCNQHTGEIVTKYCEIHREVICEKCAANVHKVCKHVKPLKEAVMHNNEDIKRNNDLLADEASLAKSIFDDRVQADKKIDKDQVDMLQNVKAVRQIINEHLTRCETQLVTEIYGIHNKEKSEIQSDVKEAQRLRKSASKLLGLSTSAIRYGSDSHALQILPEAEVQSEQYRRKLGTLNSRLKTVNLDFVVEDVLGRLMAGINRLGEVQVRTSSAEVPSSQLLQLPRDADSDPEDEYDMRRSRKSLKADAKSLRSVKFTQLSRRVSATLIKTFSGRAVSDVEACWFTGIIFLSNGQLVLVDRNNCKIKIFNKEHALISDYKLSHQPFGATLVAGNEIAITIPRENKIELFNVGKKLVHKQTIMTSDRCYGISYAADRFAVTCACASPPLIKIISDEGEEKHDICPEEDFYPMFFRPWYAKLDQTGNYVYVSDCHRGHMTCISGSVLRRYRYKDTSLNSPRGLFVLPDGRILICGFGSDNVQVIGENGILVGDLLSRSDGIMGPQEVTCDPKTNTMFLTFDPSSGNSDNINVYRMSI